MNLCVYFIDFNSKDWSEREKYLEFEIKSIVFTAFYDERCSNSGFEIALKINRGKEYKHLLATVFQPTLENNINNEYKLKKYLTNSDIIKITKELVSHKDNSFFANKYYYKKRNYAEETIIYSREVKV